MYLARSFRILPVLALLLLGTAGFAAEAESDPASDAYRAQERAARAQYMTDLESARAKYGEGTPEYQNAVNQAAEAYRSHLAAATPAPAVQPEPIPFPADDGSIPVAQESSDWEKFKGASKEAGDAIGTGAEKAGKAIGRGASRVGKFFKDGYEDVKGAVSD